MNQAHARDISTLSSVEQTKWIEGARIGRIVAVDSKGRVQIDYPGNSLGPLTALLCASLSEKAQQVIKDSPPRIVLVFEDNDPSKPIIVDFLIDKIDLPEKEMLALDISPEQNITLDGKTIQFNADDQIVLKCGKASITLTRSGKVLIRGAYLLNRSSGVNRIRGASVHVN